MDEREKGPLFANKILITRAFVEFFRSFSLTLACLAFDDDRSWRLSVLASVKKELIVREGMEINAINKTCMSC
jgi:hypothetical protein